MYAIAAARRPKAGIFCAGSIKVRELRQLIQNLTQEIAVVLPMAGSLKPKNPIDSTTQITTMILAVVRAEVLVCCKRCLKHHKLASANIIIMRAV